MAVDFIMGQRYVSMCPGAVVPTRYLGEFTADTSVNVRILFRSKMNGNGLFWPRKCENDFQMPSIFHPRCCFLDEKSTLATEPPNCEIA